MSQRLPPSVVAFYSAAQLAKHVENTIEQLIDRSDDLQCDTIYTAIIGAIADYATRVIIPCAKMKCGGKEFASLLLIQVMVPFNRKHMTERGIDFLANLMVKEEVTCAPLCDMFFSDGSKCSNETSENPRNFVITLKSYGSSFIEDMQNARVSLE